MIIERRINVGPNYRPEDHVLGAHAPELFFTQFALNYLARGQRPPQKGQIIIDRNLAYPAHGFTLSHHETPALLICTGPYAGYMGINKQEKDIVLGLTQKEVVPAHFGEIYNGENIFDTVALCPLDVTALPFKTDTELYDYVREYYEGFGLGYADAVRKIKKRTTKFKTNGIPDYLRGFRELALADADVPTCLGALMEATKVVEFDREQFVRNITPRSL